MLRVSLHAGLLVDRSEANQIGALDIAYQKRAAMADYVTSLTMRGKGELQPAILQDYPRWSSSTWDLVARALTAILYRSDKAPPILKVDKRCAYTTKMCATIHRPTLEDGGPLIASVEVLQPGRTRGEYRAVFTEDITGGMASDFCYGTKQLNPADLLLRAICYAMWGDEFLGERPGLYIPPSMKVDNVDRIDLQSMPEPARTGFLRYLVRQNAAAKPELMPKASDYVAFITKG